MHTSHLHLDSAGLRTGQLVITDNAARSPHIVQFSGTGIAVNAGDFSLGTTSNSSNILAGQTVTYSLLAVAGAGFSDNVTPTCAGVPADSACAGVPNAFPLGFATVIGAPPICDNSLSAPRLTGLLPRISPLPCRGMASPFLLGCFCCGVLASAPRCNHLFYCSHSSSPRCSFPVASDNNLPSRHKHSPGAHSVWCSKWGHPRMSKKRSGCRMRDVGVKNGR